MGQHKVLNHNYLIKLLNSHAENIDKRRKPASAPEQT